MSESIRVKKLDNKIRKNGFDYKLIERTDTKAIYSQEDYGFEVFKIKPSKPHPKCQEDIKNFDLIEHFPSDAVFGRSAWSYRTIEDAKKRYMTL